MCDQHNISAVLITTTSASAALTSLLVPDPFQWITAIKFWEYAGDSEVLKYK